MSCQGCAKQGSCSHQPGGNTLKFEQNELSHIKHVIGVVSGKGGVGKSFATGSLAVSLARKGYKIGILDADITGPSIPRMFGLAHTHAETVGDLLLPSITKHDIKIMSANLILASEDEPVLWRGPVMAGALRQFWTQTAWGDIDYLLVDMPPGTSDIALTVFQSLPIEGIVLVSTPQSLVQMVVGKAVNMARKMNIPILGLVENMSYIACDCGNKLEVFGASQLTTTTDHYKIAPLDRLAIDTNLAASCDTGSIEEVLPEDFVPLTVEAVLKVQTPENTLCPHAE